MIQAAIFDMDGLLIDSEPLWREAEVATFQSLGVPMTYDMLDETHGRREDELIAYWYEKFPWSGKTPGEVEEEINEKVLDLIKTDGQPKKGVKDILEFLSTKDLKFAIASSSNLLFIKTVIEKFDIAEYFDILHSGEFEEFGKPHPAIYLTTLEKLDIPAHNAIAFEDSVSGVKAAKAAQVKCIAVPEELNIGNPALDIADKIIPSLAAFDESMWEVING